MDLLACGVIAAMFTEDSLRESVLQGIPVLVSLVDERFSECGMLTHIGVKCIWHILELHGNVPLNHLCRLLAADGLPYRLLRALNAIITEMLASPTAVQVQLQPFHCTCSEYFKSSGHVQR